MKQTQADFDQGYQTALKDIEDKKKEHPEWSMKDIVYDLGYMCPFFPSFWTKGMKRYVVIRTKWGLGYMKALTDKEKESEECKTAKDTSQATTKLACQTRSTKK